MGWARRDNAKAIERKAKVARDVALDAGQCYGFTKVALRRPIARLLVLGRARFRFLVEIMEFRSNSSSEHYFWCRVREVSPFHWPSQRDVGRDAVKSGKNYQFTNDCDHGIVAGEISILHGAPSSCSSNQPLLAPTASCGEVIAFRYESPQ